MDCLRRKHHKKGEHKKLRPSSPQVSPTHSQPSTLGTVVNSSLPKVSSTGLWMKTPGVYAVPSPESYYYARPHGYNIHGVDPAYHMPRVLSETRIPQPGLPYVPHGLQFGSQNNLFLLPMAPQRFYHSQHMAPVYEQPSSPPPRGMEIYSYPFSGEIGGFRSKLLETRHTPEYYNNTSEFILKARVERAKSDAEDKVPIKLRQNKEQQKQFQAPSNDGGTRPASKYNVSQPSVFVDENHQLLKSSRNSAGPQRTTIDSFHGAHFNNAFSSDTANSPTKVSDFAKLPIVQQPLPNGASNGSTSVSISQNSSSLATDSMKLLAKNKTDDQKTQPSFTHLKTDNNANKMDENNREINSRHYTYEGSLYSMPRKNTNDSDYYNPYINLMKGMAIERSRHSISSSPRNNWENPYESTSLNKGKAITRAETDTVQGVSKVTKVTKTEVIESFKKERILDKTYTLQHQTNHSKDILDNLNLPDILVPGDEIHKNHLPRVSIEHENSKRSTVAAASRNQIIDPSKDVAQRTKEVLSPKWSLDTDGSGDDLNKAGKQIATSAFQFLDSYLSDDDGTESLRESPPLSPRGLRAGQVY